MKTFWKIFIADSKRVLLGKFPYIFVFVILLITIAFLCCIEFVNREADLSNQKSFYGIKQYKTLQQLNDDLAVKRESFLQLKEQFETDIKQENLTLTEIKKFEEQVNSLNRTIMTMQYLSDNNISFSRYQDYYNLQTFGPSDRRSESKNVISLIMVITVLIGIMTVIKAARIIPGEIKESKSKIMLTLPLGRIQYAVYRLLITFFQSAILMIAYSIILAFFCFLFYGGDDVLIFASANTVFGLSYIPSVLYILLFSLIQIFAVTVIAYSISLLFQSRLWAMLISLFVCYGSEIINFIINLFFKDMTKYVFSNNLTPLKAYTELNADTVSFSLFVLLSYIVIISIIAFIKFAKQDIK